MLLEARFFEEIERLATEIGVFITSDCAILFGHTQVIGADRPAVGDYIRGNLGWAQRTVRQWDADICISPCWRYLYCIQGVPRIVAADEGRRMKIQNLNGFPVAILKARKAWGGTGPDLL